MESQTEDKRDTNNSADSWNTFANVIDRLSFVIIAVFYLIAMISLLPERYFDAKNVNSVQIIGY